MRTDEKKGFRSSRLFLGKNKVMQLALGTSPDTEYEDGLHKISRDISGNVGLLFTDLETEDVKERLEHFVEEDFARAGDYATETFKLEGGKLPTMQHTMVDELRKLGLTCKLVNGVVTLEGDHVVCKKGARLTPSQAALLKHFGVKMSEFRVTLVSRWAKEGGEYADLREDDEGEKKKKKKEKKKKKKDDMED